MKKYWLIILCFCALDVQAQTLRDAVAVVRPNYTASTVKFLTGFSSSLRKDGYTAAANLLAAYSRGGYGTGVLWKNPEDGRYYIITNRHVVAQAKDVNIEFMPADAPGIKYRNCRIVAVDEGTDMALIALPDDASFAVSPALLAAKPADGDEVYTAGFPGLGSDPSWQLGKGIVSNSSVKLKDWTIQKSAKIIQHTAQVDAGSSGGPLLVKDSSPAGYSIIGINTWQARNRENANFSVAAATVQEFLTGHFAQADPQSEANLRDRAQRFAGAVKEGYRAVYPYISDDYIENVSVNDFYELLGSLSDSVSTEVGGCFGNGMPVDGVRIGLAEALCSRFRKRAVDFNSIGSFSDNSAKAVFDSGNSQITSEWTFRNGEWGMSDFSALSMRDMSKSGVATTFGYKNAILFSVGFPANDLTEMHYTLAYEYTLATFFLFGLDFSKGNFKNPYVKSDFINNNWMDRDTVRIVGNTCIGAHLGFQFPVKLGSVYIIPNAKAYWGVNFMDDEVEADGAAISWAYSFGLNGAYKLKRKTYLIGGMQYKVPKFMGDDYPSAKPRLIELMVGITF